MPNDADDVDEQNYLDAFYSVLDETDKFDCFLNIPEMNTPAENPLNVDWIREQQQKDTVLIDRANNERHVYKTLKIILKYYVTSDLAMTKLDNGRLL